MRWPLQYRSTLNKASSMLDQITIFKSDRFTIPLWLYFPVNCRKKRNPGTFTIRLQDMVRNCNQNFSTTKTFSFQLMKHQSSRLIMLGPGSIAHVYGSFIFVLRFCLARKHSSNSISSTSWFKMHNFSMKFDYMCTKCTVYDADYPLTV